MARCTMLQLWSLLESFCYQHMLCLIFPHVCKQTQLSAHFVQVGNMGFWPKMCLDIIQFVNSVIVRCYSPKFQEEAHVLLYIYIYIYHHGYRWNTGNYHKNMCTVISGSLSPWHGMACPYVADGGMASHVEGSCE